VNTGGDALQALGPVVDTIEGGHVGCDTIQGRKRWGKLRTSIYFFAIATSCKA
jgi:hypothetical protein